MKRICPQCYAPLSGSRCSCGFAAAPNGDFALALPNYVLLAGRYILLHVIGAGGFGVTYKALDTRTKTICAIKEYVPVGVARRLEDGTLVPDSQAKAAIYRHALQRFTEEAYILQSLNDLPTTASITDFFEENGTACFVMEYISGRNIKQEVGLQGKLPLSRAVSILGAVATALEHIHTKAKIFHRDISPENIMLTADGGIRLLDFGSAKLVAKQTDQHFTVVLKAGYAPPEQYSTASPQGPFTDVYALASTFYYMVTGTKIPDAPARIHGSRYIPLKELIQAPPALSDAVDRALALNRQSRTQSCARFWLEVQNSLQTAEKSPAKQDTPAKTPPTPGRGMGCIIVRCGSKAFGLRLRPDTVYTVGRSSKSSIVLPPDQRISNLHFYLYFDSQSRMFAVKDVSKNGIRINNYPMMKNYFRTLAPGTVLDLADHACQVTLCVE